MEEWERSLALNAKIAHNNNSILTPIKRLIVDDRLTKSESKLNKMNFFCCAKYNRNSDHQINR
jgi:hypothetical protein